MASGSSSPPWRQVCSTVANQSASQPATQGCPQDPQDTPSAATPEPPLPLPLPQMGLALGVVSVAFDSSGAWGAATSLDSYVSVWSMAAYNSSYQIQLAPSEAWGLAFAPAGASDALTLAVAGGSSNRVKIWDVAQAVQKEVATIEMPVPEEKQRKERFTLSVAYSPDGRRLAAGGMDGTVAVFDVATSKLLHTLDGHFRPVRSLTFTPGQQQGDACGKKKERNVTSQCLAWRLMAVTFSAEASHQFSTAVCWPVMLLICVFCSLLQPRHCLLLHTRALHLSRPPAHPAPTQRGGASSHPPTPTSFLSPPPVQTPNSSSPPATTPALTSTTRSREPWWRPSAATSHGCSQSLPILTALPLPPAAATARSSCGICTRGPVHRR